MAYLAFAFKVKMIGSEQQSQRRIKLDLKATSCQIVVCVCAGRWVLTEKKHEGNFWAARNVLYLDLGVGYVGAYIYAYKLYFNF